MPDSGQARKRRHGEIVELHIPSALGWERVAMDLAASVALHMGFDASRVEDIKTAVAEATLNAIEHGNKMDPDSEVRIALEPETDRLEIRVHDRSNASVGDLVNLQPAPTVESRLGVEGRARGWGVFLMKSLMDEVDFGSTGDGNVVRMTVRIDRPRTRSARRGRALPMRRTDQA